MKTDYKARLRLLVSRKPRLVIRKSNNKIYLQLIKYNQEGDQVLFGIDSNKLRDYGWRYKLNNLPACYLSGLLFGLELKKQKLIDVVLDFGLSVSVYGSSLYSTLKGVIDSGLNINHDSKILPSEDRIKGKHILNYSVELKKQPEKHKKQFSSYLKNNNNPDDIVKNFDEVKQKILSKNG